MSDSQNGNGIGEQIKNALAEALQTGDFKNLNDLVSWTVTNTLNEVGKSMTQGGEKVQSVGSFSGYGKTEDGAAWEEEQRRQQERWRRQEEQMRQKQEQMQRRQEEQMRQQHEQIRRQEEQMRKKQEQIRKREEQIQKQRAQMQKQERQMQYKQELTPQNKGYMPPVKMNKTGSVSNVLYQVFGGVGLGFTSIATFAHMVTSMLEGATLAGWIANLAVLAFFFGMIRHGSSQRKRLKRAMRYVQLCGGRMYGEIESLAKATGRSVRYVVRDIQKMLALNMFPEGHLDEKKTCLMLNDTVYGQYLDAENSRRLREEQDRKALEQKEPDEKLENQTQQDIRSEQEAELDIMIAEGMECVGKLNALNEQIPGEVISAKLFRLEGLLKDIFASLKEHPEQMHRMHKLMDYYLPTTLKLVEAYEDFDRITTPGEEIVAAKTEIENTLDTINQAFTELLNNLFQDAVFDATTDAQVLKTMLAREGLTREMELKDGGRIDE
ncbi:MAG: 5-bromo-4-chloroindolyl phosphate hydrolysis family protein [Muribaculaceae bacterium]|nr:5-bromo-4-chloroindolyl phosphate hydrolysis family protein [Muribaculaceae bacterium]